MNYFGKNIHPLLPSTHNTEFCTPVYLLFLLSEAWSSYLVAADPFFLIYGTLDQPDKFVPGRLSYDVKLPGGRSQGGFQENLKAQQCHRSEWPLALIFLLNSPPQGVASSLLVATGSGQTGLLHLTALIPALANFLLVSWLDLSGRPASN